MRTGIIFLYVFYYLVLFCAEAQQQSDGSNTNFSGSDVIQPGLRDACYECSRVPLVQSFTGTSCSSAELACRLARVFAELNLFTQCSGFSCNLSSSIPTQFSASTSAPSTSPSQSRCGHSPTRTQCTEQPVGPLPAASCPSGGAFYCSIFCSSGCLCGPTADAPSSGSTVTSAELFGFTNTAIGGSTLEVLPGPALKVIAGPTTTQFPQREGLDITINASRVASMMVTLGVASAQTQSQTPGTQQQQQQQGSLQVVPLLTTSGSSEVQPLWSLMSQSFGSMQQSQATPGVQTSQSNVSYVLSMMPLLSGLNLQNARVEARLGGRTVAIRGLQSSSSSTAARRKSLRPPRAPVVDESNQSLDPTASSTLPPYDGRPLTDPDQILNNPDQVPSMYNGFGEKRTPQSLVPVSKLLSRRQTFQVQLQPVSNTPSLPAAPTAPAPPPQTVPPGIGQTQQQSQQQSSSSSQQQQQQQSPAQGTGQSSSTPQPQQQQQQQQQQTTTASSLANVLAIIPDNGERIINPYLAVDSQIWALVGLKRAAVVKLFGPELTVSCANSVNISSSSSSSSSYSATSVEVLADQIVLIVPQPFNGTSSQQHSLQNIWILAQGLPGFTVFNEVPLVRGTEQ